MHQKRFDFQVAFKPALDFCLLFDSITTRRFFLFGNPVEGREGRVAVLGCVHHVCEHVPICVAKEQDCQDAREKGDWRPFPNFSGGFFKALGDDSDKICTPPWGECSPWSEVIVVWRIKSWRGATCKQVREQSQQAKKA